MKEQTPSVTDAVRGFSDLVNRVRYRGESATLTKNDRPVPRLVQVNTFVMACSLLLAASTGVARKQES